MMSCETTVCTCCAPTILTSGSLSRSHTSATMCPCGAYAPEGEQQCCTEPEYGHGLPLQAYAPEGDQGRLHRAESGHCFPLQACARG